MCVYIRNIELSIHTHTHTHTHTHMRVCALATKYRYYYGNNGLNMILLMKTYQQTRTAQVQKRQTGPLIYDKTSETRMAASVVDFHKYILICTFSFTTV